MTEIFVPILIILGLIALNGLFVAAEFALVGAPRAAIERRAARGERVARLVRDILHDPRLQDRYIATAQLGITFASLGLGMYGEHVLAHWLVNWFDALGASRWIAAHTVASVLAVVVLTYFHIVLGEMVPKSLALQQAERTVLWVARPMRWVKLALYPLVIGLNGLGNGLLRLVGVNRQAGSAEQYHTAEELEFIVRESQEGGLLRGEAGEILRELFEFGELTAGEVMVPRVHIVGIPVGATPSMVKDILRIARHTRYPLYKGDLDHTVGAVHIKGVLRALLAGRAVQSDDARPVPYVPEAATLDAVFAALRREHAQMAIVMDEHGGVAGLVTVEGLFEELIGEVEEEGTTQPAIYRDGDGRLRVAGTVRIEELGEALDRELGHEEVDSVSGLVLMLLGRPPKVGDVVVYDAVRFQVVAVEGRGVKECEVTLEMPTGSTA